VATGALLDWVSPPASGRVNQDDPPTSAVFSPDGSRIYTAGAKLGTIERIDIVVAPAGAAKGR
jgi:hypothetical protein